MSLNLWPRNLQLRILGLTQILVNDMFRLGCRHAYLTQFIQLCNNDVFWWLSLLRITVHAQGVDTVISKGEDR